MISHHREFIFLHIPKCGGTSIESIFGAWQNDRSKSYFNVGKNKQHYFLHEILNENPSCDHYFKFAFVRNPFARVYSEYQYIKKRKKIKFDLTFSEFCSNLDENIRLYSYSYHNALLSDYVLDQNNKTTVDFIGKLENFQVDFNILCDYLNIPPTTLPQDMRGSYADHYSNHYDKDSITSVSKKYERDLDYFKYIFNQKQS